MSIFHRFRRTRKRRHDYIIVFCTLFLVAAGLVMLASASSNLGQLRFGDSYYYLKHQIFFGLSIGLLGFFLASNIYYRYLEKFSIILLLANILLLLLVFTDLGIRAGGADRWLQLGPISFQPSELLKITAVVYLAAWFSRRKERIMSFAKGLLPPVLIIGFIVYILFKQPSTSSAIILAVISIIIYFASGAKLSHISILALVGLIAFGSIIYLTPYRWERVQAFLNPDENQLSTTYHINQTLIAIGNGGMFGTGYGQSTIKVHYLPEPIGDSIFAVIAEELGFAGVIAIIGAFLILVARTLFIAAKAQSKFGQLLLAGFGSLIAIQTFINIASVSGVIPLTGAPLPFISFGGTALAIFMVIAGIINNVSRYS